MSSKDREVWLPVENWEDLYEVSNKGRLKSLDRVVVSTNHNGTTFKRKYKGKILKQQKDSKGRYWMVQFSRKGQKRDYLSHILVAKAFIPNPHNLPCVNHKDCDTSNNCVENLEWCTYEYNVNYADAREKQKVRIVKPVLLLTKHGIYLHEWPSRIEASKQTGIPTSTIGYWCNNGCKKLPFIWKYKQN